MIMVIITALTETAMVSLPPEPTGRLHSSASLLLGGIMWLTSVQWDIDKDDVCIVFPSLKISLPQALAHSHFFPGLTASHWGSLDCSKTLEDGRALVWKTLGPWMIAWSTTPMLNLHWPEGEINLVIISFWNYKVVTAVCISWLIGKSSINYVPCSILSPWNIMPLLCQLHICLWRQKSKYRDNFLFPSLLSTFSSFCLSLMPVPPRISSPSWSSFPPAFHPVFVANEQGRLSPLLLSSVN